jgi:hypothetical protein
MGSIVYNTVILVSLGSWQQQDNGSWFSEQWGTANREELVDKMEDICKSALGFR